ETSVKGTSVMRLLVRFLGFLFAAGTVVFLVGVAAAAGLIWHFSKDLPDYSQLQDYEPPVMTRVHASDGALLGEYSKERRLYLPIQAVPKLVINAFLAAEDKNFYEHGGIDYSGMARAALVYFDKSVNELTVAEASYLAALPKAPAALHPVRNRDRAIERRNYVVDRLLENGWIKQADADKARKDPLIVTNRTNAAHIFAGEYFAEEVRR